MILDNSDQLFKIDYEWIKYVLGLYDGDPDSYSATSMLKPVREVLLNRIFPDQIRHEAGDSLALIIGVCCHELRAKVKYDGLRQEERLSVDVDGVTISGKFDTLDKAENFGIESEYPVINDLKVKTQWVWNQLVRRTSIGVSMEADFIKQLSIYRWLLFHHGEKAHDHGVMSMLSRDFNTANGCPIKYLTLPLMPLEDTNEFVTKKVAEIKPYLECTAQEDLPECTPEEKSKYGGKICTRYCSARSVCDYGSY
jgi:hypothetical protein